MKRFVATTKATQKQSSIFAFMVKASLALSASHCHLEALKRPLTPAKRGPGRPRQKIRKLLNPTKD